MCQLDEDTTIDSSQTISKNVTLSLALKSGRDMAPCIGSRLCRRPSRRQLWGLNSLILFLRWARFGLKGLNMYYGRETTSRHNGVRHRILSAMAHRPFPFCFPVFLFSHPFHGRVFYIYIYIYCFLSRVFLVFPVIPSCPFTPIGPLPAILFHFHSPAHTRAFATPRQLLAVGALAAIVCCVEHSSTPLTCRLPPSQGTK